MWNMKRLLNCLNIEWYNTLKELIKKFKEWISTKRRDRDMALFTRLANDSQSGMRQVMEQASFRSAITMMMKMMDQEGFSHCCFCPKRGTLRNHPISVGVKVCQAHYDLVERDLKRQKEQAKA